VKARADCVVLDPDLGTEVVDQPVERHPFRRAHVGRRDDAESDSPVAQLRQLAFEKASSVPLDEGAQEIDVVGTGELCPQLASHAGFAVSVGQQSCFR